MTGNHQRNITLAAIQMDATFAPLSDRLQRADALVAQAAAGRADLVALPELFNTGNIYSDDLVRCAEDIHGPTVSWMREKAAHHGIHLAGSLLLREKGQVYNALLLVAPDGRVWRYDKSYPWGWERACFRGRKGITVAQTDLGDIGLMICWDAAHLNLWQQYSGQVDLMLICSCPPDVTNPTFAFDAGQPIALDDFGMLGRTLKDTGRLLFGDMVNQQTAWLGVPTLQTTGTGRLRTPLPNGFWSLLAFLPMAPKLARYLRRAKSVSLECDFIPGCKIVDHLGQVRSELPEARGEALTLAEVSLPPVKARPRAPQPKSLLPGIAYLASDVILPLLMRSVYRAALRQTNRTSTAEFYQV